MYLLRRAAVRAISQQPTRQLSTFRPSAVSRITFQQSPKPTLCRSFHQSRIWRAEEEKRDAEAVKDEVAAVAEKAEEAAEAAQEAAGEAVTQAAASRAPAAEPAVKEAQEIAEGEASVAADAAQTAAAASATASTSTPAPSDYPPEPRQPAHWPPSDHPVTRSQNGGAPVPTRILYVGNLFFEVTTAQLEQEFSRYGQVVNSRIVTDPRGLSKGFGYIEFADQASADRALAELDQKVFQGRRMAVQYHVRRERAPSTMANRNQPRQPSKTLFIGNMSYQMSDKDLNELFREVRDVLDVRVAIDRRSGQPRGFAHADFVDIPSAQRAKKLLESKVIYGRQLRVDFSESSSQVRTL